MALPKLELKPGYTESFYGGRGHEDVLVLLQDIHAGVLELGLGVCEVLAHDHPQRPAFGFDLSPKKEDAAGNARWWEFFIDMPHYNGTKDRLPPCIREVIVDTSGRIRLAAMLQLGMSVEAIEARLSEPALILVRSKIARLEQARKAETIMSLASGSGSSPGVFVTDPANTLGKLTHQIDVLKERELERTGTRLV
jgi:hypothetical protein